MRAVLAALAALFVAVGSASAADLIGGKLTAGAGVATVESLATIPVEVTLTGENVSASPRSFMLLPGEARTVALSGPSTGDLTAHLAAVRGSISGDSASVNLTVTLSPYQAPFPWGTLAIVALLALGVALAVRRIRPWEFRVARKAD